MDAVLDKFHIFVGAGGREFFAGLVHKAISSSHKYAGDALWTSLGILEGFEKESDEITRDVLNLLGGGEYTRARRRAQSIASARERVFEIWEVVICADNHPHGLLDKIASGKLIYLNDA